MRLIKFDTCQLSNIFYGGSEEKLGIIYNNDKYMLKFQKIIPTGFRYNTISEYIGSHIYQLLGFNIQNTLLGTYDNKNVVACKDFVIDGYMFVPFNDIGESTIEENKEKYKYSYEDIIKLLESNRKLTKKDETISLFFEMFIVDALIGNFDRHGGNWGFLKKDNQYYMAPIFDNGSCLFPNMIDENQMKLIIENEDELNMRVYTFPTSQILLNGKKSSYYEVISSLQFEEMNKALKKVYPKINLNKIYKLIDDIDFISDTHKLFYKTILKERYEKIIEYSYLKLGGKKDERI